MQAYILRRDGRDYQAPDLETLRSWARDGRVLPGDMVYSPRYQSWYRARDLRELRAVLPAQEAAPRSSARQQFWLRKGDQNYATDNLETILRWASEGNIDPDDYIYHPSYGKWFRAGDSPQLASRFPLQLKQRNEAYDREADEALAERADSVARTAVDLPTEAIRQALLERKVSAEGEPRDTRPLTEADRARVQAAAKAPASLPVAQPAPAQPVALQPVVARPLPAQPAPTPVAAQPAPVPVAAQPVAQPVAAQPAAPQPAPAAAALEVQPEQAEEAEHDSHPPAMEVDRDARFHDRFGAMKLLYDTARVFVVTRDLRPGEVLEADCRLASTGDDFRGHSKRAIYGTLLHHLQQHHDGPLTQIAGQLQAGERPGYHLLMARVEVLLEAFRRADRVIGQKPPERFVVGNQGRPKMTPAEEEAMLKIDAALTGVISVRRR